MRRHQPTHSVAQYMTAAEFDTALDLIKSLLKPHGLLVLGDIVAPITSAANDALALLRFAAANGFFVAAAAGLLRTLFSDYSRLRSSVGLTRYDVTAITTKLATHGFSTVRARRNIGLQTRLRSMYRAGGGHLVRFGVLVDHLTCLALTYLRPGEGRFPGCNVGKNMSDGVFTPAGVHFPPFPRPRTSSSAR